MTAEHRVERIKTALEKALSPTQLVVEDEGHLHIGHAGAKTGKGHFHVSIYSNAFADKNSLACHRLIYAALGDLMETDIHALRITLL
ncbi:MAG: cell division protein BolA [Gammaproteobacteria bacterium]|jgi:BolA protein|nr:cell division protein BolA [Gammaproteobacteria bacterium]